MIPQVERAQRLTPEQLSQIYVTGSQNKLVPLSTFASLRTTTEPRELKKFQQLNAVRIQGVVPPGVPLDRALRLLEEEAKTILPQVSRSITLENRASCGLRAASFCPLSCCREF